ncbi:CRISPR-associated helicase Cas3' [Spirosoma sp. 48-14]|uniref:CRISPR-associated helicase Cas3' n=2 Tax=unclassified Spirosoma TaxID=2621999 RepID=UPI0009661CE2|nr:CRISPR-associated helicase Cas3' [Spirosoma sp. 48-14]OJW70708.1 MAG: CRISPR-associated helicase Cas3' [Spirosoma sp. 48-14]
MTTTESLAKPSGITFTQHVTGVVNEGQMLMRCLSTTFDKYHQLTGNDLRKRLNIACKFHDDGKKHPKWQSACQQDYNDYLKWHAEFGGSYQDYERACKGQTGRNLLKADIRHEIDSLIQRQKGNFSLPVQIAIGAHHGKLSVRHEDKWKRPVFKGEGEKLWRKFKQHNNQFESHHDFEKALLPHYEYAGVRSYLQVADRRTSAKESGENLSDPKSFEYKFPHSERRNVQRIVEANWQEELLLVRAPTGAGKTDSALLWASKQIEAGRAQRLVIAMPTRFTSNALSINVAESLSDTGLYHSSAWHNKFRLAIEEKRIHFKEAQKQHESARQLMTPVTVCTIDHLLMSLTLTREDHHLIAFNLANSCLVIDEADFYDDFTQANILILLTALHAWKVPVLLMSASLPDSCLPLYQATGYDVKKIYEDESDLERIRCNIKSIREYESISELEGLLNKCIKARCAIIYANTVAKAMQFYDWFCGQGVTPTLYHSRFTEPHKKEKEDILLEKLGRKAWEEKLAEGIVILTQIGEMSVNISADIMLSELCPIDRLIQRAGRLSRFSTTGVGELHVVIPTTNGEIYPAPYGTYKRGASWLPSPCLVSTKDKLAVRSYSANVFTSILNEVYATTSVQSTKAQTNAENLKQLFITNWIIGSMSTTREDDAETAFWRSRDIVGNDSVFIGKLEQTAFKNWSDFNATKNDQAIELPVYLIEKGLKIGALYTENVYIDEDLTKVYVANDGLYNEDIGLTLRELTTIDNFL